MKLEEVLNILREDDKRITKAKVEIIEFFLENKNFITVNELRERLIHGADMSTIYRNLEVFCDIGFLEKMEKNDKRWYRLKEENTKNRMYIICDDCGKRRVLEKSPAVIVDNNVEGYEITGYKFEFKGLCNDCKNEKYIRGDILLEKSRKINSKEILNEIKKMVGFLSCVDVSDEFDYEDMFIYDCMIPSNVVAIAEYNGYDTKIRTLDEISLREHEVEKMVGNFVYKIEEELLIRHDFENIRVDYKLYTFLDYSDSIKFVMIVDFSEKSVHEVFRIKDIIADTQLSGKSKYLY